MASPREQKDARVRRKEAEAAEAARRTKTRRIQWAAGGLTAAAVAIVAVVVVATSGTADDRPAAASVALPAVKTADLTAAAKAAGATFTSYKFAYGINDHVTEQVKYPMNPPTNGPHYPSPAGDGNYVGVTLPRIEELVHSLEHGRIEIEYRPGLPQAQIDQLQALYDEDPQHMLLFENPTGMTADVAVTAWGHGMLVPKFSPAVFDAARAFRDRYRDKGPEYVA